MPFSASAPKIKFMKNIILGLLFTAAFLLVAGGSSAQFTLSASITVRTAPPPLVVYEQPLCPVDGYLWSPGYWAYDDIDGYYWVPGAWIVPPMPGYLWTPGYWGYSGGIYGWHGGYWGTHVGFYGGVNYGYGYGGSGFYGGAWQGGSFRYNTAVMHVNTTVVRNTYVDRTVINNTTINNTTVNNRSSFNGPGGTSARPTAIEQAALHENHVPPTSSQLAHNESASRDRSQFASVNNGHPATAAMEKPGGQRFNQQGKTAPAPLARPSGGMKPAANNSAYRPANAVNNHPSGNPAVNSQRQARPANLSARQNTNRPAQQTRPPSQQPARNNPAQHPSPKPEHGGAEAPHHKGR
jgi:hypothetical protein